MSAFSRKLSRRAVLSAAWHAAWLTAAPVWAAEAATLPIRMAFSGNFAPFSDRTPEGRMGGILVDLMERLGREIGVGFDYEDFPWARGQQMVRSDHLDGVCTIATPERRDYIDFAPTPLFAEPTALIFRRDDPRLERVTDMSGLRGLGDLRVGEPLGSGWMRPLLAGREPEWVPDVDNLLPMIAASRLDACLLGAWTARTQMARFHLEERLALKILPGEAGDNEVRFGLRKTYPDGSAILAAADAAIVRLKAAGEIERVVARHMP